MVAVVTEFEEVVVIGTAVVAELILWQAVVLASVLAIFENVVKFEVEKSVFLHFPLSLMQFSQILVSCPMVLQTKNSKLILIYINSIKFKSLNLIWHKLYFNTLRNWEIEVQYLQVIPING